MTKEKMTNLATELENCGKALLKIAEALGAQEEAAAESPKEKPAPQEAHIGRSAEGGGR